VSKLIVSEPWDFDGPSGGNELNGRVLKKFDSKTLLFESDDSVSMNGIAGRYWLLSARYIDQSFDREPYAGTVNGSLLSFIPASEDDLSELKRGSAFLIIGTLRP
jgi:hypothetical protein